MDGLSPSRRRLQSGLYLDLDSFEDLKGTGSFDFPARTRFDPPKSDGSHASELSEYGWYDDDAINNMEEAPRSHDHMSVLNRIESVRQLDLAYSANAAGAVMDPNTSASQTTALSTTGKGWGNGQKGGIKTVLFLLTQKNFTVTTRRWEEFSTSRSYFLALGVGGFRIVQNAAGQHAEYNLIVCMNSQTYCIWKRYNHFVALVEDAKKYHTYRQLKKTLAAWVELERRRKWWRCLNVKYLYQKCSMLEMFLKELVYEIRSPTLLIKFAAAKDLN